MLDWFRRIRKVSRKLTLPSRDASSGRSQIQLNPQKLTPSAEIYLGQLAYLSQRVAEILQADSIFAPTTAFRQKQLRIAELYSARQKELSLLLSKTAVPQAWADQGYTDRIDLLFLRTSGSGWQESLVRLHIVLGILEDCALAVAKGLTPAKRSKVVELLEQRDLAEFCRTALELEISKQPQISGRLAMFARSVVADALLEVRDSVDLGKIMEEVSTDQEELARAQFKALEPFVSELIASHAVRMDQLGLTA